MKKDEKDINNSSTHSYFTKTVCLRYDTFCAFLDYIEFMYWMSLPGRNYLNNMYHIIAIRNIITCMKNAYCRARLFWEIVLLIKLV